MKNYAPKVMFIALDSAARNLVLRWCEQGLLPNIQSLIKSSAWGMTRNSRGVYTGSLWPSVWTGTTPGEHGCYYNEQIVPGTYETAEFLGRDIKGEPFWNELSEAGYRVCVFDVPKTPLSENLNGVHIVDWGTHDSDVPACSWPASLIQDIKEKFGASPFRRCDWVMEGRKPEQTLQKHLLKRIKTKLAIAQDLLQQEPWDLFMVGFGDSHCVGHQNWHVHDPTHPDHDPELLRKMGDPVREIYIALDDAVGQLLEHTDDQTTVVLHCSHGMSTHYDATHLLDPVLRRLEGRPAPRMRTLLDGAQKLWKRLPLKVTGLATGLARTIHRLPDASDRANRPCFVVPTNANAAGIRLNLVGREPQGKIRPGHDADAFIAGLVNDLEALFDPNDGRKLVKGIIRSSESFPGQSVDLLPDLFILWNRDKPVAGVSSPKTGTLRSSEFAHGRSGDHRSGGLLIMRCKNIKAGATLPPINDEDIAPTLAACLGVQLNHVSGHSIFQPVDAS
jgi:predicted AlkP superfamily phosphohydrolase/phosphomutase